MAYTPVPSVAAGDWIDEIFINTYWRDNMAASVPDVFSAKGQLAVGTGVDTMGVLSAGSNNKVLMADSAQATGLKWDFNVVPFTTALENSSYDGDNIAVGTYTVVANTFNSNIPLTARCIILTLVAKWTSVNLNASVSIFNADAANATPIGVKVRAHDTGWQDNHGIVSLNGSGQFKIEVLGSEAPSVIIQVWGYVL